MKMYCTCILLSAIVLMHLVAVVISVGSSTRYYANGTSVTCQGVICPLDKIFVPCTHSMGDRRHDTCELCPSDKPRTLDTFDSSAFEDPPDVCKSVLERCTCVEEAELVNSEECAKTLLPNCSCNITAGYYGPDPNACLLSENKQCKLPGYELKQDGNCEECPRDTYKNTHQFGRCLPQPRCYPSLVVDDPGDKAHRRTCKTPVTLPPPDRRSTSRESTSASTVTGINNSTPSYSTSSVAASTNQTNPLLDSTNSEWIYGAVILFVLLIVCVSTCVYCVIRRKKRQNRNRQQRHQTNDDDLENGMENNNLMHSVNSHQQDNSGDCHKLSRVLYMFKRKFCTRTSGSSKRTITEMNGDETAEKVIGDETAENVNDDETAEKMNGGETAEKVNGGETAEKVNSGETAQKVNDETAQKVNGGETAEKVNGDETAEKVNGGETAEKVNDDETAEKVTKIDSCENTTTNPCATENHEASYASLDVNSLFSSDLSSLKFGLSTLDFSSFKAVQNRPEEDLSFQRSLDQPHHMPLLLSQRQADSGISDTTPAECGSQAGNSVPRLSLSSFNQDQDGN